MTTVDIANHYLFGCKGALCDCSKWNNADYSKLCDMSSVKAMAILRDAFPSESKANKLDGNFFGYMENLYRQNRR